MGKAYFQQWQTKAAADDHDDWMTLTVYESNDTALNKIGTDDCTPITIDLKYIKITNQRKK